MASHAPQLPEPPSIGRQFRPAFSQIIGIVILLLIVALALLGVFGTSERRVTVEGGPVRLDASYPDRFRYKTIHAIGVEITNTSSSPLETVTVRFDRDFIDAFSTVTFSPPLTRVTSDAYEIELGDLRAGEMRPASAEVQAEAYWGHPGFIEAATPEGSARVDVHTIVFP